MIAHNPSKLLVTVFLMGLLSGTALSGDSRGPSEPAFWTPKDPPGAEYRLDVKIVVEAGVAVVSGRGTVTLSNTAIRPLSVLAFEWTASPAQTLELTVDGRPLRRLNEGLGLPLTTPIFYELPDPLGPAKKARIDIVFSSRAGTGDGQIDLKAWHPRLWWEGLPARDSFKIKVDIPKGYVMAVSGRLNPKTGYYENDCVTTRFGVFLSNTLQAESREAEGVLVTALFTEKGKDCARHCLDAAADIIPFYKKWLGVYPHKSLFIIPGGPQPWGGYPYASGIVVIHGEETFDPKKGEKELNWWRWITAHEIGHQYWGEFIMPEDVRGPFTDSWFMIGMGIGMDKAYMLSTGHGFERHRGFIEGYLEGVKAKSDTTMDAPPSLARTQKFDTNNVVIHGKGFAVLSALEAVIGAEAFDRIYRHTVAGFAGKRLGWREFRKICEAETDQDLGWFFEDWVRSNKILECRITSQTSNPGAGGFVSEVRVEYALESIRMPVPVRAGFEDGTSQVQWTNRFAQLNTLKFESRAKLKEAKIDPGGRLAVVSVPIPRSGAELAEAIDNLDWTGAGEAALAIFKRPEAAGIKDAHAWFKLGLLLFDGRHYPESFAAFKKCGEFDRSKINSFGALVWMGITKDLLDERDAAIGFYLEALKQDTGRTMQHDQYSLRINKAWVEERLKTPFKWDR
ncbi:MAG: hypothetical protein ABSG19_06880 [Candidatus Aminicenantales bacterium]